MIKNHQFATTPSFYNIIFLYFYIFIFLYFYIFIFLYFYIFIFLYFYISIFLYFYIFIFLYFYISIFPSTNLTAVPPISTSIFSSLIWIFPIISLFLPNFSPCVTTTFSSDFIFPIVCK